MGRWGWHGVDLDGTLAEYHGWIAPDYIGPPIPAMVDRVKKWLEDGEAVCIFTARVARDDDGRARAAINVWCKENIGMILPITCKKDMGMIDLWDDRAVQVEINTGRRMDGQDG